MRVDRFSIGFGPALWSFRRGETEYRLSLIPAGGYVKLAGETAAETKSDDPALFMNKRPGVRAIVFAAGATMNVLLGLALFSIIFRIGYPFIRPEVGLVEPGGPAARAGLQEGDLIVGVDGQRDVDFDDVRMAQVFSRPGKNVALLVERPGEADAVRLYLTPDPIAPKQDYPQWGLEPAASMAVEYVDPKSRMAKEGSILVDDRILSVDGREIDSWRAFMDVMIARPGAEIPVTVERDGERVETKVTVGTFHDYDLGMELKSGMLITEITYGRPAALAGLRAGDVIESIDGKPIRNWKSIRDALNATGGEAADVGVRKGEDTEIISITPVANRSSVGEDTPSYLPQYVLGVAGAFSSTLAAVREDSAAWQAGLRAEDKLTAIRLIPKEGKAITRELTQVTPDDENLIDTSLNAGMGVEVHWLRQGKKTTGTLTPSPAYQMAKLEIFPRFKEIRRELRGLAPLRLAVRKSYHLVVSFVQAVRSIARGSLRAEKALAGPVGILHLSYQVAREGLMQFVYFLALINVNLAFVNLLPIPILDGGHLLFIGIESVRGKRLSDRAMELAQFAGLAILLALLVFALYADFSRFF